MDAQLFTDILKDYSLLNSYSLEELQQIAKENPLNQSIYLFIAKKAHLLNDRNFEHYLNKAAIRVADRKRLYELIHDNQESVNLTKLKQPTKKSNKKEKSTSIITDSKSTENTSLIEKTATIKETKNKKIAKQTLTTEPVKGTKTSKEKAPLKAKNKTAKAKENILTNLKKPEKKLLPKTVKAKDNKTHIEEKNIKKESELVEQPTNELHSFTDWFAHLSQPQPNELKQTNKEEDIIEYSTYEAKLIKEVALADEVELEDKIDNLPTQTNEEIQENVSQLAQNSIRKDDNMVTETLATVYEIQKKYDKAIDVYERLSLLVPNKKSFFAKKINRLKTES